MSVVKGYSNDFVKNELKKIMKVKKSDQLFMRQRGVPSHHQSNKI